MKSKQIPFQDICDAIFRPEILPAVYRWISGLNSESLQRFNYVYKRLTTDNSDNITELPTQNTKEKLQTSKYTMREWSTLKPDNTEVVSKTRSINDYLARATSSNLTYGAFDEEQMRASRARPTRTRANDVSQINSTERSPEYMARWSERMMNTSYRNDICRSGFKRTIKDQNIDQTVIIYSKNTLNNVACERAKKYIDVDAAWTRHFREMCRSLSDSLDATAYRNNFTSIKQSKGERHVHPKWVDTLPPTKGMTRPAESYWETTMHADLRPSERADETFVVTDQHHACYSCPFDHHPLTEKPQSSFRSDFQDHMATKDDHPEYFKDMRVRMPPGSGVIGDVIGTTGYE